MISTQVPRARLLVVIVNYRTPELTIDCLRSLEDEVRALGSTQVVVTDNASGDGSPERIRAAIARHGWSSWATVVPLEHNGGYSFGNNAAIRPALEARIPPDYFLLLNSDTTVRPRALSALVEFMDTHPAVGIAGSRLEDPDGKVQNSSYRFHSIWSEIESGLKLGVVTRLLKERVVAAPLVDEAHPADWVAGASMMIRREVFEDVGLLDPEYFLYYEEVDFCLNARRAGWSCWYVPRSRVVHLVGRSTGITGGRAPAVRRPRYWFDSRRRYFTKNHGRAYAACADAAWFAAFSLWRVRRAIQGKPDQDPPHMLWDFCRARFAPREERALRRRRRVGRLLQRMLVVGLLAFALLEVGARALTGTSRNGMPTIGRHPLLPFRPPEELTRERLARDAGSTYVVRDDELGWTIGPGGTSGGDGGSPVYASNAQGARAELDRAYAAEPPQGVVRIVTVGDSFTHCDDVGNGETWQRALEDEDPGLEVVNLGVPGYGTDQAFLRWRRDGAQLRSQLVVLGIWPENMFRNLNVLRYYLVPTEGYASKPRLVVRDGVPEWVNVPVLGPEALARTLAAPETSALLADDAWYDPEETRPKLLHRLRVARVAESLLALARRKELRERMYSGEDPAAIDATVAVAEEFARAVRAAGSTPLVLLIPMRDLLAAHASDRPFPLVAALREREIPVIDLGPTFGRAVLDRGVDPAYGDGGHHSPEGNRLLARILREELRPFVEAARP